MLVWLDSFEVLAPRRQEWSSTLTKSTAATSDAVIVRERLEALTDERARSATPKRRRRPNEPSSDEAPV
ncbi:hypothetical protein LuPra_06301 [Luteitalea pratensis]|uniref:Uncharacterized protein n=1 Tax=Luteitalea pratensis TaxID=1855912 RepID=A0A143PWD7_LUTPR|nr:hypothetical protein [Luteitalea pratensis]AMY13015.1 hypothetical protein LuPra_06301 [Luteitalea pratensis]